MGSWNPFTDHEKKVIRENYEEMTDKRIAKKIGCSVHRVTNCRHKLGLKKGYGKGSHPNAWSDKENSILKQHYETTSIKELAALLPGRSESAIYGHADVMGLKKDKDYLAEIQSANGDHLAKHGAATRFDKGHVPINKGKKQEEFMSPEAIERTKGTRFQKGNKPHNTKFDGAITVRHNHKDRGEEPYLWIRVSEGNWELYHRYLWEKVNGEIPEKHVITFKDGNTFNCSISNLECISMAENARRNCDWEKAQQTMKEQGNRAAVDLTDAWVASMIAGHDEEIKQYLLDEKPELIRLARANYKLNRKIKQDGNNE